MQDGFIRLSKGGFRQELLKKCGQPDFGGQCIQINHGAMYQNITGCTYLEFRNFVFFKCSRVGDDDLSCDQQVKTSLVESDALTRESQSSST